MNPEVSLQEKIVEKRHLVGTSNFWHDNPDGTYYEDFGYAAEEIEPLVRGRKDVLVIPYATGFHETPQAHAEVFKRWGAKSVNLLHEHVGDEQAVIDNSSVIDGVGGNYYRLVANLYALRNTEGLLMDPRPQAVQTAIAEALRRRIAEGIPFIGVSAGLLAMAEDGRYADDPIEPEYLQPDGTVRVDGLNLLPSHIRVMPHLTDPNIPGIINRIITEDPSKIVLGVNNYSILLVEGQNARIAGTAETVLFEAGKAPQSLQPGQDVSHLLLPRQAA